jgi:hypothetical protein
LAAEGTVFRFPQQGHLIYLFSKETRPALGPTQPLILWLLRTFPVRVKRRQREADQSSEFSAKFKNKFFYRLISLHVGKSDSIAFTFTFTKVRLFEN